MGTNEPTLSERGKKFNELANHFFGELRTAFLSKVDKEGGIVNLKQFIEKWGHKDIQLDPKSKFIFDKIVYEQAKADKLMSTALNMIKVLVEKEKVAYDERKLILATTHEHIKKFVETLNRELPGVLDEIAG